MVNKYVSILNLLVFRKKEVNLSNFLIIRMINSKNIDIFICY